MSGHSKWSTIKHKKAINDARKANIFTRYAKLIEVAARAGADPETNFNLRMAIDKARSVNMPKANIERAVKRGSGQDKDRIALEEIIYEAYGPGQVALLIQCITDNKNRTLSEVKTILKKNGGKFVEGGGVSWQFEQKGLIKLTDFQEKDKESIEEILLESEADDYRFAGDNLYIFTQVDKLKEVRDFLTEKNSADLYKIAEAKLIFRSKENIKPTTEELEQLENLLSLLRENNDVVDIWTNLSE